MRDLAIWRTLRSLRFRLLVLVLLCVVPALALLLHSARAQREEADTLAREKAVRLTRLTAATHERFVDAAHQLLLALAQIPETRADDPRVCSALLGRLLRQYPQYANLGVVRPDGDLTCSALPLGGAVNVSDRSYFKLAVERRDFAVGEFQVGRVTGRPSLNFGYPLVDAAGSVAGVVYAAVDVDRVNRIASESALSPDAEMFVADRLGNVVVHHPDPAHWSGRPLPEPLARGAREHHADEVVAVTGTDGRPRLYAFLPLEAAGGDLVLGVGISQEAAILEAEGRLHQSLLLLALVAATALAAAWLGSDLVLLRRIRRLVGATDRLRGGDLRVRIGEYRGGELGELARAFDEMADSLESRQAERDRAHEQIARDALHDRLTGLPNRVLFLDRLGLAIERAQRAAAHSFAVLVLDLDRFKVLNEGLGHAAGDQLLAGVAGRLEECVRPGDTVARLGGDEFAVLLDDPVAAGEAGRIADEIQAALAKPFAVAGSEVFTTASVGIVLGAAAYEAPEACLRDADTAMYRAKSQGGARHERFDTEMHSRALALLRLETDLRRALERREFKMVYQPIVSLKDGRISACEALLRWSHRDQLISPSEFIPLAEETGLITTIGEWALRTSCEQGRVWLDLGLAPVCVAVNISAYQFRQKDLTQIVARVLEETKLAPACLKLELTESALMDHAEETVGMLRGLQEIGVRLSVDDFGTGYSSLRYLRRFPIHTLKIDRDFVKGLATHPDDAAIATAVIALAHSLNLTVVAEGVETKEQLAFLFRQGCDEIQGGLFSPPVPPEEFAELLRRGATVALPPGAVLGGAAGV